MQIRLFLIVLTFIITNTTSFAGINTIEFEFYSENIIVHYDDALQLNYRVLPNDNSLQQFYEFAKYSSYQSLLKQLKNRKEQHQLNGYLYFELVHRTVEKIYKNKDPNYHTAMCWFILSESGIDTRLTYLSRTIYLYAYITDNIYNVPIINIEEREYVNLTALKKPAMANLNSSFYLINYIPNPNGNPLSFSFKILPKLRSQLHTRTIQFYDGEKEHTINIKVDKTIIDLMRNYPLVDERYYLETPLSRSVFDSLIPQLKKILAGKSELQAIQLLLSLTRTSFDYKTDSEHFGRNKPMIPDEVFYYPYSDCEDRSALFYFLVKELLDLPMIVVDYPEHLSIGVQLPENIGKPLRYRGRRYTICDPTGPSNSNRVGIYPKGYERIPYKIALSYR